GALDRDPKAVILVDPGPVGAAGHVAPPLFVVEIPMDGPADAAGKIDAAAAAELAFEFYRVDRVAVVVTGTIGHERDQRSAGTARRCRTRRKARGELCIRDKGAIDQFADQADDIAVVLLVAAADIVGFSDAAALDHVDQRAAMVGDVKPVADIGA